MADASCVYLLPNGLFAAAASGECLNKLSSEMWFARNKASRLSTPQFWVLGTSSQVRLEYALQLQNNSDSTTPFR